MLEVARRASIEGSPVGIELLFTVAEEDGLRGAKAFDVSKLQSDWGYVFDHASPVGEVIVASPTYYRLSADFHGRAASTNVVAERCRIMAEARSLDPERVESVIAEMVDAVHDGAAQAECDV